MTEEKRKKKKKRLFIPVINLFCSLGLSVVDQTYIETKQTKKEKKEYTKQIDKRKKKIT
jgi:hypothetical protein